MQIKRREITRILSCSVAWMPLAVLTSPRFVIAKDIVLLEPESAAARDLNFTRESEIEGAHCSNCLFYSSVDEQIGRCVVFGGAGVPSSGWCNAYQRKKTP